MKRPAADEIDQVEEEINWGNNSVAEIEGVQHPAQTPALVVPAEPLILVPGARPAKRGPYKKKAKIDKSVTDPLYLWVVDHFPARTVLSDDLFQEAIGRGVIFYKMFKKRERIDADNEELHCSKSAHTKHHLSSFYVKAVSFLNGIVNVQLNGACIADNDVCREVTNPFFNPSKNAAISTHRAAGGCGTGLCSEARVDGELYCEVHLAEQRRREAERSTEVSNWVSC